MRLAIVLMLWLVMLLVVIIRHLRRCLSALSGLEIDVHPAFVVLGAALQSKFLTDFLHFRLDLLNVIGTVIALAHNDVQMRLTSLLGISYPLLYYLLCFLHILPVQVYSVAGDLTDSVVFSKDVLAGLLVVRIGLGGMLF